MMKHLFSKLTAKVFICDARKFLLIINVFLINALPVLALFVFVNADVNTNSAREPNNELNGE